MVHVDDIKQCFDPFEKLHILCLWQPMLAGQKDTEIYYKVVWVLFQLIFFGWVQDAEECRDDKMIAQNQDQDQPKPSCAGQSRGVQEM